jgi:hypothetical protein
MVLKEKKRLRNDRAKTARVKFPYFLRQTGILIEEPRKDKLAIEELIEEPNPRI